MKKQELDKILKDSANKINSAIAEIDPKLAQIDAEIAKIPDAKPNTVYFFDENGRKLGQSDSNKDLSKEYISDSYTSMTGVPENTSKIVSTGDINSSSKLISVKYDYESFPISKSEEIKNKFKDDSLTSFYELDERNGTKTLVAKTFVSIQPDVFVNGKATLEGGLRANIIAKDSVNIKGDYINGNITSGSDIKTQVDSSDGDLSAKGSITILEDFSYGKNLTAGGNISLVRAWNNSIKSGGNVTLISQDSGNIDAIGSVTAQDHLFDSHMTAGGDIKAGLDIFGGMNSGGNIVSERIAVLDSGRTTKNTSVSANGYIKTKEVSPHNKILAKTLYLPDGVQAPKNVNGKVQHIPLTEWETTPINPNDALKNASTRPYRDSYISEKIHQSVDEINFGKMAEIFGMKCSPQTEQSDVRLPNIPAKTGQICK